MKNKLYINIWDYVDEDYPFQIFVGGRGTGKTYSALSGVTNEENMLQHGIEKFIFMRRTANEMDLLVDSDQRGEGANPFKPINRDFNRNIGMKSIVKNLAGIYNRTVDENERFIHSGAPIGYAVALSTVSSIRGVDFSDSTDLIYDEFIPEKHVKKMKGECTALLNAIETINRNREFDGGSPIRVWLLANSNDIYNPIFVGLGIVSEVERMQRAGKSDRYLKERGLAIHLVNNNEDFVEKKKETALYKLTKGTQFYDMALNNEFSYNDFSLIAHRNLKGYIPICALDNAYLYRKKGDSEIYVCYSPARVPTYHSDQEHDLKLFMQEFGLALNEPLIHGCMIFESYELKQKIVELIL